jgi:hypothetical protein
MPITKTGDMTIMTLSPEDEKRAIEFERQAIEANLPVVQYGGASVIEENDESAGQKPVIKTSTDTTASSIKLYRLMKKIARGQPDTAISPIEFHGASIAEKSVTNNYQQNNIINSDNNIKLLRLVKRIAGITSPSLL